MTLDPGQEGVPPVTSISIGDYEIPVRTDPAMPEDAFRLEAAMPPANTLDSFVRQHQPTQLADGRVVCQADGEPFPCRVNTTVTLELVSVLGLD